MLELAQQSRQPHNQHKPNSSRIGAGLEESHHPRLQMLVDKMHARLANAKDEIDRDIFERFCERMLPVTFLDWMRTP